jgi:hypothetical protein
MFYTFDFIDADGRIDHFDIAYCVSDGAAELAAVKALLHSSIAERVEVWENERHVTEVERPPEVGFLS